MPVQRKTYISIRCDRCDAGEDILDWSSVPEIMEQLKADGWTGTYRKCFCPKCSREKAAEKTPL